MDAALILSQVLTWLSFPSILAAIGIAGAIFTAILAYRKAKPEATAIIVDAAKDIVVLQKGELERLRGSLEAAHKQIKELEKENFSLKKQLKHEERRIADLERRLDALDKG